MVLSTYYLTFRVYKFYFCLPVSIMEEAFSFFDQHNDKIMQLYGGKEYRRPAVLLVDEERHIFQCGGRARTKGRALTLEERVRAMRLMSIKYWDLRVKKNG